MVITKKCNLKYVGSTSTAFKVRFRNHKSAMLTNKNRVSLQFILIVSKMMFLKLVSLL